MHVVALDVRSLLRHNLISQRRGFPNFAVMQRAIMHDRRRVPRRKLYDDLWRRRLFRYNRDRIAEFYRKRELCDGKRGEGESVHEDDTGRPGLIAHDLTAVRKAVEELLHAVETLLLQRMSGPARQRVSFLEVTEVTEPRDDLVVYEVVASSADRWKKSALLLFDARTPTAARRRSSRPQEDFLPCTVRIRPQKVDGPTLKQGDETGNANPNAIVIRNLFPPVAVASIAHEIGHALNFLLMSSDTKGGWTRGTAGRIMLSPRALELPSHVMEFLLTSTGATKKDDPALLRTARLVELVHEIVALRAGSTKLCDGRRRRVVAARKRGGFLMLRNFLGWLQGGLAWLSGSTGRVSPVPSNRRASSKDLPLRRLAHCVNSAVARGSMHPNDNCARLVQNKLSGRVSGGANGVPLAGYVSAQRLARRWIRDEYSTSQTKEALLFQLLAAPDAYVRTTKRRSEVLRRRRPRGCQRESNRRKFFFFCAASGRAALAEPGVFL